MCAQGDGVPKDRKIAYAWFTVAIKNGDIEGASQSLRYLKNFMVPKDIEDGEVLSKQYIEKYSKPCSVPIDYYKKRTP